MHSAHLGWGGRYRSRSSTLGRFSASGPLSPMPRFWQRAYLDQSALTRVTRERSEGPGSGALPGLPILGPLEAPPGNKQSKGTKKQQHRTSHRARYCNAKDATRRKRGEHISCSPAAPLWSMARPSYKGQSTLSKGSALGFYK